MRSSWTEAEIVEFIELYPEKGKAWCMKHFSKSEGQVRDKASRLGLRINQNSEFMKRSKKLMGEKLKGRKRPQHSEVMKNRYSENCPMTQWVKNNGQEISRKAKERIQDKGHPRGALGLKHSEETKEILSQKSKLMWKNMDEKAKDELISKRLRTWAKNGNQVVHRKASWKGAWRDIGGKNHFFRSAWEANYARYLQWLKSHNKIKDWDHEPKTFWFEGIKRGCVSYLPDFLVQEIDGSESYHEVKGWMDDRSKTKIARMARYFPKIKLIVIDKKSYRSLEKTMKSFICDWE